jgi:hypothetical protein
MGRPPRLFPSLFPAFWIWFQKAPESTMDMVPEGCQKHNEKKKKKKLSQILIYYDENSLRVFKDFTKCKLVNLIST